MLDRWTSHEFSKAQFGFIKHRGTDMATALLHSCVFSDSQTRQFYLNLLKENNFKKNSGGRVQSLMPVNNVVELLLQNS